MCNCVLCGFWCLSFWCVSCIFVYFCVFMYLCVMRIMYIMCICVIRASHVHSGFCLFVCLCLCVCVCVVLCVRYVCVWCIHTSLDYKIVDFVICTLVRTLVLYLNDILFSERWIYLWEETFTSLGRWPWRCTFTTHGMDIFNTTKWSSTWGWPRTSRKLIW